MAEVSIFMSSMVVACPEDNVFTEDGSTFKSKVSIGTIGSKDAYGRQRARSQKLSNEKPSFDANGQRRS